MRALACVVAAVAILALTGCTQGSPAGGPESLEPELVLATVTSPGDEPAGATTSEGVSGNFPSVVGVLTYSDAGCVSVQVDGELVPALFSEGARVLPDREGIVVAGEDSADPMVYLFGSPVAVSTVKLPPTAATDLPVACESGYFFAVAGR